MFISLINLRNRYGITFVNLLAVHDDSDQNSKQQSKDMHRLAIKGVNLDFIKNYQQIKNTF